MANARRARGTRGRRKAPSLAAAATGDQATDVQVSVSDDTVVPVVVYRRPRRRKKKKARASAGLKDLQRLQRRTVKGTDRVADAVAAGLTTFRRRNNRSARKKRDGAIRDLPENLSRGLGRTLRRASRVPYDLTRGRGFVPWRPVRTLIGIAAFPLSPFLR